MQRFVKWLVRGCFFAVLLCVVGCAGLYVTGYALDPEVSVSVQADSPASLEQVHGMVSTAAGVKHWWDGVAADMGMEGGMDVVHAGGPAEGPGCVVTFATAGMVTETWTLREVEPHRVVWQVDFGTFTVMRTLDLSPSGSGTTVRWTEHGTIDDPLTRWMGVLMPPSQLEAQFTAAIRGMRG